MKRICLIAGNVLPIPAVKGGAVEELITLLLEQNELEKKAELVIFSMADAQAEEAAKKYKNSRIIYIPADNILDKINNRIRRYLTKPSEPGALLDSGYFRKIYKILCGMEFDAIVGEGGLYHEYRQFARKFGADKVYLHIHHHVEVEDAYDQIFGNIIAVSEFAKKEWIRTTKKKNIGSHVVYNCVNEEKFQKRITVQQRELLRERLGIAKEDFVVLYCGRIQEVKGVRELLQAFSHLSTEDMKLLIIGNADFATNTMTPFMEEVKGLVEKNQDRIKFTGYIENKDLYQYYQCADIQVIPSMWEEAAGLVAIEGMLQGLPLIVTRSGGLIEYAPEDVAMWVEREGIVENLQSAIMRLYEDATLRETMSEASLKRSWDFSKSIYYNNYLGVFERE